jgi:DNA-binding NarL/FixJ family response regulator
MGLKEQNLQLERLIAHLEARNISQQQEMVEAVAGSIHELIDNNNKLIEKTKSNVTSPPHKLTDREVELLKLIVEDKTNKEIAAIMYLHIATVKANISSLLKKLGLRRRVHLAIYAVKYGIVKEEDINL